MSDDFARRLDEELGSTLDAIAADRAMKIVAARLAAEKIDERLSEAKLALDALLVPRMQALATKLGAGAPRTGQTDPQTEAAAWCCAIPLALMGDVPLAAYAGDCIVGTIAPSTDGQSYHVTVWSRLRDNTEREECTFRRDPAGKAEVQAWIDERLIRCAQRHLGLQRG
ncbi:MAG: hypothetical protein HYX69_23110 [Planctomycetia bacterium]|nr:hypothetical protein [Planctomycetia bacterium]